MRVESGERRGAGVTRGDLTPGRAWPWEDDVTSLSLVHKRQRTGLCLHAGPYRPQRNGNN